MPITFTCVFGRLRVACSRDEYERRRVWMTFFCFTKHSIYFTREMLKKKKNLRRALLESSWYSSGIKYKTRLKTIIRGARVQKKLRRVMTEHFTLWVSSSKKNLSRVSVLGSRLNEHWRKRAALLLQRILQTSMSAERKPYSVIVYGRCTFRQKFFLGEKCRTRLLSETRNCVQKAMISKRRRDKGKTQRKNY